MIQSTPETLDNIETIEIEFHSDINISHFWNTSSTRIAIDKIPGIFDIILTEHNSCVFDMEPTSNFTEYEAVYKVFHILWNLYHIPMCAYLCSQNDVLFYPDKPSFEYSHTIDTIYNTLLKEDPHLHKHFPHTSDHFHKYKYISEYLFHKHYPGNPLVKLN